MLGSHLSIFVRNPVRVFDTQTHKPVCAAVEVTWMLETLNLETREILQYIYAVKNKCADQTVQ